MDPISREERNLQRESRLRGAQRREGRDFDFGFNIPSLPPPVAKAPSPSEPPFRPPAASQPELTAQLSSGSSNGRGRGRPRSLPKDAPPKAAVNNANTSAKRRKSRSEGPPGLAEQQVSSRTTRSSPNAQVDIYAIPEDLDADPVLQLQNDLNNSIQEQGDAILEEPTEVIVGEQVELSIEEQADAKIESGQELEAVLPEPAQAKEATPVAAQGGDEVTESPADAPGSGHRKRIGLNTSALHSTRLQDVVQIEGPTDVAELEASAAKGRKRKRGKTSQPPTKRSRRSLSKDEASAVPSDLEKFPPATRTLRGLSVAGNEIAETNGLEESVLRFALEDDIDDPSPQPRVRRSKRSSSKNESVAPEADADVAMDIEEDAEAEDDVPVAIEGEAEEAEEIGDEEASSILKKNRGRRVSRNAPRAGSPDLDEPAEELSQPKRKKARKAQVTPAKQSQPKKAASRKEKAGSKAEKESSRGKPLSIAVHRMSQRPTYDDDVPDAHILNSDIPYIKRPGVNTIDMLSQIAWDTTNSAIEQLDSGIQNTEDKNLKKEYKTKRSAIYAFSSELQSRLAEHTINLDNTFALTRRLQSATRAKLSLRDEILAIRKEREQIAIRMDSIRNTHEREATQHQQLDTLNTAITDIEIAVERGREHAAADVDGEPVKLTGMELLLKRVAGEVSGASDEGGILKQIREFNGFLDRALGILEK